MRKHRILLQLGFVLLVALDMSCKKDSSPAVNNPPVTSPSGNVATYELIEIPGLSNQAGLGALTTQFYCTNIGPYLHVVNTPAKSSIIYKYRGGTGADAWLNFIPEPSLLTSFIPSDQYDEDRDEMSFFWCNGDPNFEYEYGMANAGNGSPSYKHQLLGQFDDDIEPALFASVYPPSSAAAKVWGVASNKIWYEGSNASTFDLITETPQGENIVVGFVDPDNNMFWCASEKMLFQTDFISKDLKFGDLSSLGEGSITAITKAKESIFIQYGRYILRISGNQLVVVKTLNQSSSGIIQWASITSSGEILFANDGTFYDAPTNTWKSFIGSGLNLNDDENLKFRQLLNFLNFGYPIAATKGVGPVYLLAGKELLKIDPKY